jgi:hypothetical protein
MPTPKKPPSEHGKPGRQGIDEANQDLFDFLQGVSFNTFHSTADLMVNHTQFVQPESGKCSSCGRGPDWHAGCSIVECPKRKPWMDLYPDNRYGKGGSNDG